MAQHIQSIERAAQVLEALAEDGGDGFTKLQAGNRARSTFTHILASLTREIRANGPGKPNYTWLKV